MDAAWWADGGEPVTILGTEELWGESVATVVVASTGRIDRVPASQLQPLGDRTWLVDEVVWRAATGLAWRAMDGGEPLAIARGRIDPLPHQLAVLDRAMATHPLRLLLADEVGLGKTIEAGLVITELKARGLVQRVLVVAPKGVQLQWVAEMADRFDEEFVLVGTGGIPLDVGVNPWRAFNQVVCSLDAVKPMRGRTGWTPERVAEYNNRRVQAIVEADWDLVVIDEAHHVAGSSEEVARHQLGRRLADAAPRLLLLSATPHSGKSDAFARLLGLLDDGFVGGRPIERSAVAPLVVRTEKRHATDSAGHPLFRPRTTTLATIPYRDRAVERALYEAVTDYVRHGYRRARAERRPAVGFLVLLMQRLVSSSTAAISAALERRLVAVTVEGQQLRLFTDRVNEWGDLTGEEQQAALADAQGAAWGDERAEVELLVDLARKSMAAGIDAKARYLLELLGQVARAEGDPSTKAVVFTEFVPTQDMLLDVLDGAGISAVAINGSMSIAEQRHAQEEFRTNARVLVSTDAGGEGVNLQFAHVVINYDLPWSPTRIEQRIGRVDRIGQAYEVAAHNLVLEASIDARVLDVLQSKLAVILAELGVDKTTDVLASVEAHVDDLYTTAILEPERLQQAAEEMAHGARADVNEVGPLRDALGPSMVPARPSRPSSLRRWLDIADDARRRLRDGGRGVDGSIPQIVPGEPVPVLSGSTSGWWTMWEIRTGTEHTAAALFVTDTGAVRPDIAERTWIALTETGESGLTRPLRNEEFERLRVLAADHTYRDTHGAIPSLTLRLAARVDP
ncbi:MAG: helicase-related protein [Chloroflexota bacterium]